MGRGVSRSGRSAGDGPQVQRASVAPSEAPRFEPLGLLHLALSARGVRGLSDALVALVALVAPQPGPTGPKRRPE